MLFEPANACCSVPPYALYNLDSGQWTDFHISPQCQGDAPNLFQAVCSPVGIGPYWVKLRAFAGPSGHESNFYSLQDGPQPSRTQSRQAAMYSMTLARHRGQVSCAHL